MYHGCKNDNSNDNNHLAYEFVDTLNEIQIRCAPRRQGRQAYGKEGKFLEEKLAFD